jgi:hypothetical protein
MVRICRWVNTLDAGPGKRRCRGDAAAVVVMNRVLPAWPA